MSAVLEEVVDERGIAILTLNRPQVSNALSDELFEALAEAFTRLDRRQDIGVIVLTGRGPAFCAGGDVAQMPGNSQELTFETRVSNLERRAAAIRIIRDSSKVTIAMVNGAAVGAGLALALACDFRFAGQSARLTTGYLNIGLSGDCGAVHLLTHLVGESRAKELFLLPEMLSAAQALALGLINRCLPDESLEADTLALAARLAAGPRVAQRYLKMNFRNTGRELADAMRDEAVYLVRSALSDDHSEAKAAFRERRPPRFTGT
ncbi:MAG: 2-(1,2-epoxy,2-dihydrophenyl)acetyl-CoA isomerase [Gammaproteobacteria bacterium]|jgi:enoyl-CoA hydratase/carnithine racemase|nr:2-(1,2-epoxy,2-dihydrophenyl)acetyl-CoA isomerase [Gammaproteobacteria bacterium]